ncbi:MAG: hypothetical protein US68_C0001G0054 [Candidatus Shapirobacteria bacterium GW2011_GWE1_38_10]|uniref:Uncharacterized protein n=1 Tax=Candidatus Shapirobacteria bacterium GW2011_GWE1_38_10 TaxID=1618488 RepID=A0A0G0IIL6_9BACT|nr:MAG: hypothetical protein US46_C0004G0028 [Candidatus Shapirobacteria bacterium GW2011_GWF2_37_20]KKQ50855.1 MAG: hypothetical protein US68_C0001G0054 [Candidatus Shapirobacteria bacterium GW2011_GWE1_38_10]KKQ63622.1 MAG: hypothetical protein US85_C0015G0004 [Candidatus Shapirobacteria bacterium GW2011_GWF1_38_23]HBP51068.1 hypothetical protein [Candidatus Shapirobacteria bacterium]
MPGKITTVEGISVSVDLSKICENCGAYRGELEIVARRLFPNNHMGSGVAVIECLPGGDEEGRTRRLNIKGSIDGKYFESMNDLKDWSVRLVHCGQKPKKAARS